MTRVNGVIRVTRVLRLTRVNRVTRVATCDKSNKRPQSDMSDKIY